MVIPELAHFPVDPTYGCGAYRRRLAFTAVPGAVIAQVDDSFHSYWMALDHDHDRVTGIEAGFSRAPTDMCGGAIGGLKAVVGCPLDLRPRDLLAKLPPTSNCTHLADLAVWAIAHVGRSAIWEVKVPDQTDVAVWMAVRRDGQLVHRWQVAGLELMAPHDLAGKPLMAGFIKWASGTFSDDDLLAATMLQRGLFVARGRRHVVDRGKPVSLSSAHGMSGMCWAYSDERRLMGTGTIGYVRDFTKSVRPETLPAHIQERLEEI